MPPLDDFSVRQVFEQPLCHGSYCRRIEHHLVVPPEFLEKVTRASRGSFHCLNNLCDGPTSVYGLIHLFLVRIDQKKQILKLTGRVQQRTGRLRRKVFLNTPGPRKVKRHIVQITFVVEADLQLIILQIPCEEIVALSPIAEMRSPVVSRFGGDPVTSMTVACVKTIGA